jgi:apolipoprotein N-acyltransferase
MKRIHFLLLSLLSALLFSIPYFRWGTGILLFFAFVPLLFIEDEMSRRKAAAAAKGTEDTGAISQGRSRRKPVAAAAKHSRKTRKGDRSSGKPGRMTWWFVLAFALWVLLTCYWVYFATWVGIVGALIVNSAYMTLTFWGFHRIKLRLGPRLGYASFVIFWLAFEFLYIHARVNFPWTLLGNGFANDVMLIQWYELTGVLGGSLWVLLMNLAVFRLVNGWRELRAAGGPGTRPPTGSGMRSFLANYAPLRSRLSWVVALFLLPALFSIIRFLTYEEDDDPYEMVVVQPNIDPYMKFGDIPQAEQTGILIRLADSLVTPNTEYIIGPETVINNSLWQERIQSQPDILRIREFLASHPRVKMVIGATTFKLYRDPSEFTESSRPLHQSNYRYDSFNSALQVCLTGEIPMYHKSRLVVGVEFMPYKKILGFLEPLTIRLGGTFRSPATQVFRETFASPTDSTRVGPVICWESVFGEYVTEYVRDAGANFLFIITNDGWWRNTPGHRQHNAYAHLRAIENRRSIARSANTGISSLIDQRGRELARIGWWQRSAIRGTLNKNEHLTFYTRHGDYLGRISVLFTVILLLYALVFRYIKK